MTKNKIETKAVIFDVGDVLLVKTVDIERQIANYLNISYQRYIDAEKEVISTNAKAKAGWNNIKTLEAEIRYMKYFYSQVLRKLGLAPTNEQIQFATMCRVKRTYQEVEGAEDLLKYLRSKYRLAVLSNCLVSRKYFEMKDFGYEKYFETVVLSREFATDKPDPKIFNIVLKKLKLPPSECVFVDNKIENIQTANELGFGRSILFDPKGKHPEYNTRVSSHGELSKYV